MTTIYSKDILSSMEVSISGIIILDSNECIVTLGIHKFSDKFSFYVAGSIKLDWSNCGEVLAVGGFTRLPNLQCQNEIHFYTKEGQLLHRVYLPCQVKFNMKLKREVKGKRRGVQIYF